MSTLDVLPIPSRRPPRQITAMAALLDRLPALTLATVGVALLAALVVTQAEHGFTDPDYWWHFKTGEYIVLHHALPRVDIFTWTAAGHRWVVHEWLSEVAIYLLVRAGGYGLALAFFTVSPLLSILLLYRLLRREGAAPAAALTVLALSTLMIATYSTVRPQVLSWLFFTILLSALYAYRAGRIQHLWGLPALFALWANLHLSFLIGLAIFGLFVATRAAERWLARRPLRPGLPLTALAASVGAACLNPTGPRLLLYPFDYLPLQRTLLPALQEWRTPDFHALIFVPLLVAMLLLIVTGLTPRRLDLWALSLGLMVTALALQSTRYIPVFAIAYAPLAASALSARWPWAQSHSGAAPEHGRSILHWALLVCAIGVLGTTLQQSRWTEFQRAPRTDGQSVPVHAVDVIEQQFPDARIFNQYEWGGYLIYRLWPQQRPFVDGRGDMFDSKLLQEYLEAYAVQPGWEATLDRYGVNLVIVRSDSSLAGALQTNIRWHLVSRDDVATVYVRG